MADLAGCCRDGNRRGSGVSAWSILKTFPQLLAGLTLGLGLAVAPIDVLAAGPGVSIRSAAERGTDTRHSGSLDMSPALQAMQAEDSQNPAQLWVVSGRERWRTECSGCHGEVEMSMAGVAARFPSLEARSDQVLTLNRRIRACRGRTGGADTAGRDGTESEPVLALQALVALQSRDLPLQPGRDARSDALASQGEQLFRSRMGALELSCADCHESRAGLRLGGSLIPQGHPTGYPLYRLEWQGLGSLGRRLRSCVVGVRATPFAPDSQEALALEVYLSRRAAGMAMDAPGLRP